MFVLVPPSDLDVHVLNTEMDLQDLSFPQNYASDSTIQLSASTIKQYSRNGGQSSLQPILTPKSWQILLSCAAHSYVSIYISMNALNNLYAVD